MSSAARAGFTSDNPDINPDGWGDPRESLGTLFYHSHRPDFTTQNVYKGQLGFCRVFDELDSGSEGSGVPNNPADYYDICFRAANRYQGSIEHWGMWNEPNLSQFWAGTPGAPAPAAAEPDTARSKR